MPGLLIFSRDPAPTNYLIAAVERLRMSPGPDETEDFKAFRGAIGDRLSAMIIAVRREAGPLWNAAGYGTRLWDGFDESSAVQLIRESEADVVLTGTSDVDEPGNYFLWRGAKALGASSHVFLDHPAGLDRRFRSPTGDRFLPDWIYVPDDLFRNRALKAGLPSDKLKIAGDLHFDRLRRRKTERPAEVITALRAQWGVGPSDMAVLFVSECTREMKKFAVRKSDYDEVNVLKELLGMLQCGALPMDEHVSAASVSVVIRPHPRDAAGKYDDVVAAHRGHPRVIVSSEGDSDTAVFAADLVVGMDSSLLYEAHALGRPVRSMVKKDPTRKKSTI
jgi:hypothetical protein